MEYLRATSDEEMREIGPSPPGCGANRAILRCHPRRWSRHSHRIPPRLHSTDDDLSAGAPVWRDFRPRPGVPGVRTLHAGVERRPRESS